MCVNNKYSNVIPNTPPGGRLRNYTDWLVKIQMFQEKDSDWTKNLMDDKYWTREFVQIKYGLRGYPNFDTRNTWLLQGQQKGVEPIRILTSRDPKLIRSGLKTRRVEGGEMWAGPGVWWGAAMWLLSSCIPQVKDFGCLSQHPHSAASQSPPSKRWFPNFLTCPDSSETRLQDLRPAYVSNQAALSFWRPDSSF